VPSITAIHYTLSNVDAATNDVDLLPDVGMALNGPRVYSHPNAQFRMLSQRVRNLECAPNRRQRIAEKDQGHAIAAGKRN
jgi:hypothetical protein